MLSKKQCDIAREYTGRMDMKDEDIKREFEGLRPQEKEKIARQLWGIYTQKNDLPLIDIIDISAEYFISEPVLFCIFKDYQSAQKMSKIEKE